ncbi:MAG: signal peptide peptidase SppA [Deltaproteobacteria bacterium]|nr:signal peptide peptidase SppA [Deltaproteobacteria bacterium]
MGKRPFLMALGVFGAIFLFFVALVFLLPMGGKSGVAFSRKEKVAVLELRGVIGSSKKVNEDLIAFRDDPSVKAIVLRVDSPGGGVGASQEIYQELKKAAAVKPLVVSMGSVAASGGYYVAVPGQRIFANPGTITGSIGVLLEFVNLEELFGKIGFKVQIIKSGEHKDMGSPTRTLRPDEKKLLQEFIENVHSQFVRAVAENRPLSEEQVRALADGRIFSGEQALREGLIDELGNLQDAIDHAARLAGIVGKPKLVYPPKETISWWDFFLGEGQTRLRKIFSEQEVGLNFIWNGF